MTELLTSAQMRAIEAAAIASGSVTGLELMERAGQGVVDAIMEEWPNLKNKPSLIARLRGLPARRKAVIFCGPGNNGGDGFVIARKLHQLGWTVVCYLWGDPERLPKDAKANYLRWLDVGQVYLFDASESRDVRLCEPFPDLWVDAIFGIGQSKELPELVTLMMQRVYYEQNWCEAPIVAVDVPTGVDADTGQSLQTFLWCADLTVTFHAKKVAHDADVEIDRCGKVVVADIGL